MHLLVKSATAVAHQPDLTQLLFQVLKQQSSLQKEITSLLHQTHATFKTDHLFSTNLW